MSGATPPNPPVMMVSGDTAGNPETQDALEDIRRTGERALNRLKGETMKTEQTNTTGVPQEASSLLKACVVVLDYLEDGAYVTAFERLHHAVAREQQRLRRAVAATGKVA